METQKFNVLILGSGGREHALAWKIAKSPLCNELFVAPGNAGTSETWSNLELSVDDFEAIARSVTEKAIDILVVGPEAPLVKGLRDFFEKRPGFESLRVIGPGKAGAKLEGSKEFAKEFMARHGIPTASYRAFGKGESEDARAFLQELSPPYVLKADGLAAGKGVLIVDDREEAGREVEAMLTGKFGAASERVVIESYLDGIEISCFALTDGKQYILLPEAKDYKRVGEGDTGLNTGGMGAVSPVPFANADLRKKIEDRIVKPTVRGLAEDGIDYLGFLFFGLMIVKNDPYVIEYNVRLGDPETEVVIPRLKSDLLQHLIAAADGKIADEQIEVDPRHAATIMLVSEGYPESYEKGKPIAGLDMHGSLVFHAGTKNHKGKLVTAGGRVLACTAYGRSMQEALKNAYQSSDFIHFEGKYLRRDIGFDLG